MRINRSRIPKLIGLTGPKGVGKSTYANSLTGYWGEVFSFAEPLRQMLEVVVPRHYLTEAKEVQIPWLGSGVTGRKMLQRLGTEFGRELDSDIWVRIAEHEIASCDSTPIIFDDLRFENEAEMIKRRGGEVWLLRRASLEVSKDSHVSEAGIPEDLIDKVVDIEEHNL